MTIHATNKSEFAWRLPGTSLVERRRWAPRRRGQKAVVRRRFSHGFQLDCDFSQGERRVSHVHAGNQGHQAGLPRAHFRPTERSPRPASPSRTKVFTTRHGRSAVQWRDAGRRRRHEPRMPATGGSSATGRIIINRDGRRHPARKKQPSPGARLAAPSMGAEAAPFHTSRVGGPGGRLSRDRAPVSVALEKRRLQGGGDDRT